jgi:hypothetical protein
MFPKAKRPKRCAAATVETAIVLPIAFFLVAAIAIGGMLVFKAQEIGHIARETARYASVHGNVCYMATGTATTESALITYAQGKALTIPSNQLTSSQVTVNMLVIKPGTAAASTQPAASTVDWDDTTNNQHRSPYSTWTNNSSGSNVTTTVCNMVIVTVTYTWDPNIYFLGPIKLSSTSTMPMCY